MKRLVGSFFLWLWGFKIVGRKPTDDKLMFVVMNHTSMWDFPLGLFIRWKLGLNISYVGKASLFKFPLGILMRYLGGYPVERDSKQKKYSVVKQIEEIINKVDKIMFTFTPEGTRRKVTTLKSGFYTIARDTGIKIALVDFDFSRKLVRMDVSHEPFPTFEEELRYMKSFYKDSKGYHPELSFDWNNVN